MDPHHNGSDAMSEPLGQTCVVTCYQMALNPLRLRAVRRWSEARVAKSSNSSPGPEGPGGSGQSNFQHVWSVPYFMGDICSAPVPRLAFPSVVQVGKGREAMCVWRKVHNRYWATLDSRKAGAGAGQTMPLSLILARLSPLATAVEMLPDLEMTQQSSHSWGPGRLGGGRDGGSSTTSWRVRPFGGFCFVLFFNFFFF